MSEEPEAPWYTQLHWQILIGLLVALAYALAVRAAVDMPQIPDAEVAGESATAAADVAIERSVETARANARAAETLEPWRAPFSFAGDVFLRLLKLIVLPLILTSVITGIMRLSSPSELGRLGLLTIGYYVVTSLLAVTLGMLVVNTLRPGEGLDLTVGGEAELEPTPLSDVFLNIVPDNIFAALSSGEMLPTIFVAIITGLAILLLGQKVDLVRRAINQAHQIVMLLTDWVMKTAPVGVGALLVSTLLDPELADLGQFFGDMGMYMASVLGGLGLHALVVLPLLLWLVARTNPWKYAQALSPALLTAFSTASSSATYPVTLECVTERAGVSEKSADFVLPIGATVNMDGTALYEAVA
ncbi:MAG: dicarboxylate/amino acid:cation symporter, partial [Persicimonas sp.]